MALSGAAHKILSSVMILTFISELEFGLLQISGVYFLISYAQLYLLFLHFRLRTPCTRSCLTWTAGRTWSRSGSAASRRSSTTSSSASSFCPTCCPGETISIWRTRNAMSGGAWPRTFHVAREMNCKFKMQEPHSVISNSVWILATNLATWLMNINPIIRFHAVWTRGHFLDRLE